jgi:methylated-DNA-[protein]-cysteine S-methyltransferase
MRAGAEHLAREERDALAGLWFIEGQRFLPDTTGWIDAPAMPVFGELRAWLKAYFARQQPDVTPFLNLRGTPFRHIVWALLVQIPCGQTVTYGELADKLSGNGKRMAAQAVGGAVGHNPISLIIPCHRVVGTNGSLTGYGGGLKRKKALLELERQARMM